MSNMQAARKVALASSLLLALVGPGCVSPPELPPTFSLGQLRHWFEGDRLVVNVTVTNRANFTASASGFIPYIAVYLFSEKTVSQEGKPGEETHPAGFQSLRLNLDPQGNQPWPQRLTQSLTVGPILLPPGRTLHAEFAFPLDDTMDGEEGYYYFLIEMPSFYPNAVGRPMQFYSGCFNLNMPEFYGVKQSGADCRYWDCFGTDTRFGWAADGSKQNDQAYLKHRAPCQATSAAGPWG